MVEVKAMGRKLPGSHVEPSLYGGDCTHEGPAWSFVKILEYNEARNRCVCGRFLDSGKIFYLIQV